MDLIFANTSIEPVKFNNLSTEISAAAFGIASHLNIWQIVSLKYIMKPLNMEILAFILVKLVPIVGLIIQLCPNNYGCWRNDLLAVEIGPDINSKNSLDVSVVFKYNSSYFVVFSAKKVDNEIIFTREEWNANSGQPIRIFLTRADMYSTTRQEGGNVFINGLKKGFVIDIGRYVKTDIIYQLMPATSLELSREKESSREHYIKEVADVKLKAVEFVDGP